MSWRNESERHRLSALGIKTANKMKLDDRKNIPAIGIVFPNKKISSYSLKDALYYEHHSLILDEEDYKIWESEDDNLRFVYYHTSNMIGLKGNPSLYPFEKGNYDMITTLIRYLTKNGLPIDTKIFIENQYLGTDYEGKMVGTLEDWIDE